MEAKMGMKRKFNGKSYSLVAVVKDKKTLMKFAKNQRAVGGLIRITKDDWGKGIEYTAWHGGYKK